MKRWDMRLSEYREISNADSFLADILEVCRRHKLIISHEDEHGAFIVEPLNEAGLLWLAEAHWSGITT